MTATAVLAAIGAVTLILTAATRIPAALTEFLSACTGTVKAARELHTAFTNSRRRDAEQPAVRVITKPTNEEMAEAGRRAVARRGADTQPAGWGPRPPAPSQ